MKAKEESKEAPIVGKKRKAEKQVEDDSGKGNK